MRPEAAGIHGLTVAFLEGMPLFKEEASELVDFVSGARLIGHNAYFAHSRPPLASATSD